MDKPRRLQVSLELRKGRAFTANQWTVLAEYLEAAHEQRPEFMSFRVAQLMCQEMALLVNVRKVAAEQLKKETA